MKKLKIICDVEEEVQRAVLLLMENTHLVDFGEDNKVTLPMLAKYWIINRLEDMFMVQFTRHKYTKRADDVLDNILRRIHLDINKFKIPPQYKPEGFTFNRGSLTLLLTPT